jgi:hypothetical protein
MEESRRRQKLPLEVERGFASSRLERQILVRVYELVVPVIRRSLHAEPSRFTDREGDGRVGSSKGA